MQTSTTAKGPSWLPTASLLLAATLWGVFWYPLRALEAAGLSGLSATLFIYLGTIVYFYPLLKGQTFWYRRQPVNLFWIALCSGWCNIAFILAMLEGHVVRVLLLFYLAPVWTSLFAIWILRERPDRLAWMTLCLAMVGAVLMLWQPGVGFTWPLHRADLLAISSGMTFALTNVFVRRAQQVPVAVKTVTAWGGVVIVAALGLILTGATPDTVQGGVIMAALLVGLVLMAAMTLSVQYGVTHMPAHRSAIILLFELVVGAVSALLLTDEPVRLLEWAGGGLVVLAALGTAWQQFKTERAEET